MNKKSPQQRLISLLMLSLMVTTSLVSITTINPHSVDASRTEFIETVDYNVADFTQEVEAGSIENSVLDTIDTETTIYPQSEYSIIEAELPSDQVEINIDTLFSDESLLPFAQTDEAYTYPYFNAYKDTFRDIGTYVSYYLYYSSDLTDHYLIAPMNMINDVINLYEYSDLIAMQRLDINHKLRQIYFSEYSDDLIERYHLK